MASFRNATTVFRGFETASRTAYVPEHDYCASSALNTVQKKSAQKMMAAASNNFAGEPEMIQRSLARRPIMRRHVEICLASVLIVAAGLKTHQIAANSDLPISGPIHSKLLLAALVQVELLLALWMVVGKFPRARTVTCVVCFSVFAIVAIYEGLVGLSSCGCFGSVRIPPSITAAFDVAALASIWFTRSESALDTIIQKTRAAIIIMLGVAVSGLFWTALVLTGTFTTFPAPSNALVVLEPKSWINKPLGLIDAIENGDQLRRGHWLLVFYHFDCASCVQAIPLYMALANSFQATGENTPHVAFIAMPPLASSSQDPVPLSSRFSHFILRPDRDWFATTPVVAAVENGTVLWAQDGEEAVRPPNIQWPRSSQRQIETPTVRLR